MTPFADRVISAWPSLPCPFCAVHAVLVNARISLQITRLRPTPLILNAALHHISTPDSAFEGLDLDSQEAANLGVSVIQKDL